MKLSPGTKIILKRIVTSGDKFRNQALSKIGGKGLFTKEIEESLLRGEIDLAVHSLKDLPTRVPSGLTIGAIPKRENPFDLLIWNPGISIKDNSATLLAALPKNAKIGTSSLRRQAQLLRFNKGFQIIPLRGNLPTRLRKLKENELDAILLAQAGLKRLHSKLKHAKIIDKSVMLPAIGQGALAIECRANDTGLLQLLKKFNHKKTEQCVTAERSFLSSLGGGCQFPIAALAEIKNRKLILEGLIISPDGKKHVQGKISGKPENSEILGKKLGLRLLFKGGRKILSKLAESTK